jgi:predicted amidophosphoribosyltransferase
MIQMSLRRMERRIFDAPRARVVSGGYGSWMRLLLDIAAAPECVGCGAVGEELCTACAAGVDVLVGPRCERCGTPTASSLERCPGCRSLRGFERARSLVSYAEPARALTLALKRRGRGPLVRAVGSLLAQLARVEGMWTGDEVVAFVPAGRRARTAGFDHVELVARAVATQLECPLRRVLYRVKDGPRQADVAFSQRRTNVGDRFAARPAGGRILLIDDVFTTGATAEACSLALRAAGARSVDVLTWARTLRRRPGA